MTSTSMLNTDPGRGFLNYGSITLKRQNYNVASGEINQLFERDQSRTETRQLADKKNRA